MCIFDYSNNSEENLEYARHLAKKLAVRATAIVKIRDLVGEIQSDSTNVENIRKLNSNVVRLISTLDDSQDVNCMFDALGITDNEEAQANLQQLAEKILALKNREQLLYVNAEYDREQPQIPPQTSQVDRVKIASAVEELKKPEGDRETKLKNLTSIVTTQVLKFNKPEDVQILYEHLGINGSDAENVKKQEALKRIAGKILDISRIELPNGGVTADQLKEARTTWEKVMDWLSKLLGKIFTLEMGTSAYHRFNTFVDVLTKQEEAQQPQQLSDNL